MNVHAICTIMKPWQISGFTDKCLIKYSVGQAEKGYPKTLQKE